jgi:hypothetical protein
MQNYSERMGIRQQVRARPHARCVCLKRGHAAPCRAARSALRHPRGGHQGQGIGVRLCRVHPAAPRLPHGSLHVAAPGAHWRAVSVALCSHRGGSRHSRAPADSASTAILRPRMTWPSSCTAATPTCTAPWCARPRLGCARARDLTDHTRAPAGPQRHEPAHAQLLPFPHTGVLPALPGGEGPPGRVRAARAVPCAQCAQRSLRRWTWWCWRPASAAASTRPTCSPSPWCARRAGALDQPRAAWLTGALCWQATGISLIDYDHMEVLGDTLTLIAREKSGIFKVSICACTSLPTWDALFDGGAP